MRLKRQLGSPSLGTEAGLDQEQPAAFCCLQNQQQQLQSTLELIPLQGGVRSVRRRRAPPAPPPVEQAQSAGLAAPGTQPAPMPSTPALLRQREQQLLAAGGAAAAAAAHAQTSAVPYKLVPALPLTPAAPIAAVAAAAAAHVRIGSPPYRLVPALPRSPAAAAAAWAVEAVAAALPRDIAHVPKRTGPALRRQQQPATAAAAEPAAACMAPTAALTAAAGGAPPATPCSDVRWGAGYQAELPALRPRPSSDVRWGARHQAEVPALRPRQGAPSFREQRLLQGAARPSPSGGQLSQASASSSAGVGRRAGGSHEGEEQQSLERQRLEGGPASGPEAAPLEQAAAPRP